MRFRLDVDGETHEIDVEPTATGFLVRIDGAAYRARVGRGTDFVGVRVGRRTFRIRLEGSQAILDDGAHTTRILDVLSEEGKTTPGRQAGAGAVLAVRAPMPGRVVRVAVSPGARVRRGQTLIVLEAMKMQNEIASPGDGVVQGVAVSEGETVTADRVVAWIEPDGPSAS